MQGQALGLQGRTNSAVENKLRFFAL